MPHLESDNRAGCNETGKEAGTGGREFYISIIEKKNLEDARQKGQAGIKASGGIISSPLANQALPPLPLL